MDHTGDFMDRKREGPKRKKNPRYTGEAQQSEQLQTYLDEHSPFRNDQTTPAEIHQVSHTLGYVYDEMDGRHYVALPCQHGAIKNENKGWICRHECSDFTEA